MIGKLIDQTLEVFTDDKYLAEYVIADDISKQTKTTKCLYRNIKTELILGDLIPVK